MISTEVSFPTARDAQPQNSELPSYQSSSSSVTSCSSARPSRPRMILPAALGADTCPERHAVRFSHWTRFSASPAKPKGQLKASLLCKETGTRSSYNPPASEWVYLGSDQAAVQEQTEIRMAWREWKRQNGPGESSRSSSSSSLAMANERIAFGKQPVKRPSIQSQLTKSLLTAALGNQDMATARTNRYGLGGLRSEDLPSAFDSDDEDD
ncbi:hypothetical protein BDU57DRAFT_516559 [Ampelomyces quisqualis]|uniref:Uncharacterized protein n=1 Tax=Ampelomyces quisqualis TaxID=50730 RepID=A0A6A5QLY1_AMPQU|nr:hypothetical protein BDU57DRAFT_516559 [Ampelomyces quisqualis]